MGGFLLGDAASYLLGNTHKALLAPCHSCHIINGTPSHLGLNVSSPYTRYLAATAAPLVFIVGGIVEPLSDTLAEAAHVAATRG
jgi:hypothetical protein